MIEMSLLNQWWKGKENIAQDKHIREFEEKKYKYISPLIKEINLLENNIFTLRGPRQVGKTTLIKLMIKELLSKGINEKAIFFWNCDELVDFRELSDVLREYLRFSKINNIDKKYIFLDEISRIKNWQRSIKGLKDSGELDNSCIMMTGSHTLDIKYGMERLPGRTGKFGKDLLLLPLSFAEYVRLIKPEIIKNIERVEEFSIRKIINNAVKLTAFNSELEILFSQYLITGGFPLVINEFFINKKIPDYIYEIYLRWLIGDIVKWGKQEKIAIQLLKTIILKQSTSISWDSLAKESEIKSHKTVSSYVEDLENMFALITLYFFDINKKTTDFNKNKKIYFFDPFIFHIFNKKIYFKDNEINPSLVEAVVVSNLHRLFDSGLIPRTHYWRNKKEIDIILNLKDKIFPCEVKYQNNISKEDYVGLYYFKQGLMLTKKLFKSHEKYPAIPIHIMLAML